MSERSEAVEQQGVQDAAPTHRVTPADATADDVPHGYKRTEVGVIPKDWEVIALRELLKQPATYGIVKAGRFVSMGVPMLRGGDIKNGRVSLDLPHVTEKKSQEFSRTILARGDIVIALVGYPGEAAVVPTSLAGSNISRAVGLLKPQPHTCPAFVVSYLNSPIGRSEFLKPGAGSAQVVVNLSDLNKLKVPLPSDAEQRAIANVLSDADALIESLDRLIAKKRAIKQAAMQQLLTGQTRLPGFAGEWESFEVKDLIEDYFCGPSPTCEERNIDGDVEWGVLKTTATTRDNGWDWTKHKVLPKPYWGMESLQVQSGDVVITKAGPRHRVGVPSYVDFTPDRLIVSGKMVGLRPDQKKVIGLILSTALNSKEAQRHLDQRTTGMAESQENFENQALLYAPVRIPPLDEQFAIQHVISDMDAEIAGLVRRREKVRQIKQGMMQQLLTGRVRLVEREMAA